MKSVHKRITKINFKEAENREISYIVIHYVGAVSTAEANCKYFENVDRQSSAHYFVDEDSIWQCVEEKDIAWHVGAKTYYNDCRNSNSIGVELCCKKDKDGIWYFEPATIENAKELVSQLAQKYNIPAERIVRHYDVTRKMCPEPYVRNEEAWQDFKNMLDLSTKCLESQTNCAENQTICLEEDEMIRYKTLEEVPEYARETIKKLIDEGHIKGVTEEDLALSDDMVRMYVSLDRARIFD